MARPSPKAPPLRGLCRVKPGRILLWPPAIMNQIDHPQNARGKGGYVVDLDRPYEQFLCRGREKFLEPVPAKEQDAARAKLAEPSTWPRPVVNHLAEMGLIKRTPPIRASAKAKLERNAEAFAPPPPDLIPDLDEKPQAAKRKPPASAGQSTIEGADL